MKSLGIVRRLDELGRIVIPKEIRTKLGTGAGTPMEMFMQGANEIVIRPYIPDCVFCGEEATTTLHNKHICDNCICEISSMK